MVLQLMKNYENTSQNKVSKTLCYTMKRYFFFVIHKDYLVFNSSVKYSVMFFGSRFCSSLFALPGFYEFLWFLPEIRIFFAIWHCTFSFNAQFSVYAILGRSTSRRNLEAGKNGNTSILANIELPISFTRLLTQFSFRQIDKHLKSLGHSLASFSCSQSFIVLHT